MIIKFDDYLSTSEKLLRYIRNVENTREKIVEIVSDQQKTIEKLMDLLYEIAPEYEIIETLADSEEERKELLSRYMNLNENYLDQEKREK